MLKKVLGKKDSEKTVLEGLAFSWIAYVLTTGLLGFIAIFVISNHQSSLQSLNERQSGIHAEVLQLVVELAGDSIQYEYETEALYMASYRDGRSSGNFSGQDPNRRKQWNQTPSEILKKLSTISLLLEQEEANLPELESNAECIRKSLSNIYQYQISIPYKRNAARQAIGLAEDDQLNQQTWDSKAESNPDVAKAKKVLSDFRDSVRRFIVQAKSDAEQHGL